MCQEFADTETSKLQEKVRRVQEQSAVGEHQRGTNSAQSSAGHFTERMTFLLTEGNV